MEPYEERGAVLVGPIIFFYGVERACAELPSTKKLVGNWARVMEMQTNAKLGVSYGATSLLCAPLHSDKWKNPYLE